jgi:putative transposase
VRDQFLVEIDDGDIEDLASLNRLFDAWVETVYHRRPHGETGQAPIERFLAAGAPAPPDA